MARVVCVWPGCKAQGKPARMPLTGEFRALCDRHNPLRTLAHMIGLTSRG